MDPNLLPVVAVSITEANKKKPQKQPKMGWSEWLILVVVFAIFIGAGIALVLK
jgi:flagellar basal body-associated protein FliL